jgi:phosphoribosyl 1,2-cyclic phosphate phosphodiesterase
MQLCPLEPFTEARVGHLDVTPVLARHKPDETCLNFLLRGPDGATLLYGTDTGWWDPPTWEFLEGRRIDAVVLECGRGAVTSGYDGHLDADQCVAARERLVAAGGLAADAPFLLTHVSHTGLLLHDELTARVAPHGITVAHDGLEITV